MSAACQTCKWATEERPPGVAVVGQVQFMCRRFPPTPLAIMAPQGVTIANAFPVVSPEQWCGEYQAKLT